MCICTVKRDREGTMPPPLPGPNRVKNVCRGNSVRYSDMSDWSLCGKWFLEFPYGKSFVTLTAGPCSEAIGEVTRRHIRGWWQIVPKKHFLTPWVPRWQKHHVWCPWCWYFIVVWWNFHFLKQSHNLPDIALEGAKNCRSCEELAFSFSHSPVPTSNAGDLAEVSLSRGKIMKVGQTP